MAKSLTQKVITLSVTEAELYAVTSSCAQDMLFVWRMMQAMQLQVKLHMILQCNNKGTIDLSKNWSTGGRSNLNEQKRIQIEWIDGNENSADLGTENLDITSHKKHTATLCRNNNDIQPILK